MMRDVISHQKGPLTNNFYMAHDYAMVNGTPDLFRHFMLRGVPYYIDDWRVGIVLRGELQATINLKERRVGSGMLAFVGPGSIVQPIGVSDDFEMKGMLLPVEAVRRVSGGKLPDVFSGEVRDFQMEVGEEEKEMVCRLFDILWSMVRNPQTSRLLLGAQALALMQFYNDLYQRVSMTGFKSHSRDRDVFERFISLVNKHASCEHQLPFYSDRLCLSSRYLGTLIKQVSGIGAKEWIDRAIIVQAQVMLKHSHHTIQQIADELHFPNPSFFCQYFKRITGQTPLQYREG